jgi:hypothetical protein
MTVAGTGLLALLVCASASAAQEPRTDIVYVSGEVEAGSISGGGAHAEWVRSMSKYSHMLIGLGSTSLADESWTYGRIGGFTRRHDFTVIAFSDLGASRQKDRRFPYVHSFGAVTIPIAHHLYGQAGVQYVRASDTGTRVLMAGAVYSGLRQTLLQAAFHDSATRGSVWRYASLRGDVAIDAVTAFGGATVGRMPAQLRGATASELLALTSHNIFAGLSVRSSRAETICSVEIIRQPAAGRAARFAVTIGIPLGRGGVPAPEPVP